MSAAQRGGGGISFMGMLAIVFITLKLCHVIAWSWWWVLLPLYAPLAMFCVLTALWFVFSIIPGKRR